MSYSCPTWLQDAIRSKNHIVNVLMILEQRERKRIRAIASSRPKFKGPIARRRRPAADSTEECMDPRRHRDTYPEYSVSIAADPANRSANRYADIEPFDRTRVIVSHGTNQFRPLGPVQGRYINASWVRERYGGNWWIAAQAPLPTTAHTFLSILLQQDTNPPQSLLVSSSASSLGRVRTVVQLTLDQEAGRVKAHAYFPVEIGESYLIPPSSSHDAGHGPPLKITLVDQEYIDNAKCVRSVLHLSYYDDAHKRTDGRSDDGVVFQHLLYTAWPDHGVPSPGDKASLLRFTRLVGQANRDLSFQPPNAHPDPPIIVNCSAGIGRTGAFITLSSLMRAYSLLDIEHVQPGEVPKRQSPVPLPLPPSPLGSLPKELGADEVAQEIDSLREQRMGMVQRSEQVLLVYELLQDAFTG